MTHPPDDTLAAYAAGLLADGHAREVVEHLNICSVCERAVGEYREIAADLREWRDAPTHVVAEANDALLQRMRLHRLVHRLITDQELRRRISDDPARVLSAHGITPTPAIMAAFKDLGSVGAERFPGELDERLSKVRRLIEYFPGGPPGLGN
jgi:anti-sigma factor RsiW